MNSPSPNLTDVTVVTLVAKPDAQSKNGSIFVRTWAADGPSANLEVKESYTLKPTDVLIVTGNARCRVEVVRQTGNSAATATPIAFVESIRVEPTAPPWPSSGRPNPQEYRFLAFQCPPVLEVRHLDLDIGRVHEVFVDGAMAQILG